MVRAIVFPVRRAVAGRTTAFFDIDCMSSLPPGVRWRMTRIGIDDSQTHVLARYPRRSLRRAWIFSEFQCHFVAVCNFSTQALGEQDVTTSSCTPSSRVLVQHARDLPSVGHRRHRRKQDAAQRIDSVCSNRARTAP